MNFPIENLELLPAIKAKLDEALGAIAIKRVWWTLPDAAELKGVAEGTLRARPDYQPKGGKPDAMMHGRRVWKHDTIMDWLEVHDGNRAEYLARVNRAS